MIRNEINEVRAFKLIINSKKLIRDLGSVVTMESRNMEDFLIKRGIPRPNFNSLIRFGRVAPIGWPQLGNYKCACKNFMAAPTSRSSKRNVAT